jgi:hypothetical protein
MLLKQGQNWFVRSHEGKNLGGPYRSKAAAEKRLAQVEWFKSQGKQDKRTK